MTKRDFLEYCLNVYGTVADHPFGKYPQVAALRHGSNQKLYALVMDVSLRKLGLDSDDVAEIVNVKLPTDMFGSFGKSEGVFPAYHMNKLHWVSIVLPIASDDTVKFLVNASFEATRSTKKIKQGDTNGKI